MLIFVRWLVHINFPFNNSGWMIICVNSNSYIFLIQQSKGIIILILVFRFEFNPKRPTKINILRGICNRRIWGTEAHYRITVIHIDIINSILDCLGHIIQVLIFSKLSQNLLIGNMNSIWFYTSVSVFNCCLEYHHNTTQCLIKLLVCQFLIGHKIKYIQILWVVTTTFPLFEDTNN